MARKNTKGKKKMAQPSYLELQFERTIDRLRLPQPIREFYFHRWRFDFAWPKLKVAVEIDGGTFTGGNHVRGVGYQRDCKKNNKAQLEGWVVMRADREMVAGHEFGEDVRRMLLIRIKQHNDNIKQR
jgi:very-short-patch-repair endonuclease